MKANAELRLFAVLVCGGLVYCVAKGLIIGWNGAALFSGFLFGVVIALLLGIPLLLWGDRRHSDFKGRHLVSGLIQSLVASLLVGGSWTDVLLMTLLGGLTLGVVSTVAINGVEYLSPFLRSGIRRRLGPILAVPVSGALTSAIIGAALFPVTLETLPTLLLFALVGAALSMLAGWPVLWLMERFLSTPWRYVIGGGVTGLLIWLMFGAPMTPADSTGLSIHVGVWAPLFGYLIVPFMLTGLVAGVLCTALARIFGWRQRADN